MKSMGGKHIDQYCAWHDKTRVMCQIDVLRVRNHKLRVKNHEFRVNYYEMRVQSPEFRVQSHGLHVQEYKL